MKISDLHIVLVASIAAPILAACTSKEPPPSRDSGVKAAADSTKGGGMAAMAGMQGMMSPAMADSMQAAMRTMAAMSPDQMAAMLPMHRQMVGNMLSQMSSDMRLMNMPADAAWTALSDSVRQDLIRLPEMSKTELKEAIPAHHARVTRLMEMHKAMMAKMGK
jgi:hypothetical protein